MKLPVSFLCFMTLVAPVFAEEVQNVVERKTCEQIKTEIAALMAIENRTNDQAAELKQLTTQQRTNCGTKSGGRRTISRIPNLTAPTMPTVTSDALTEYMNNKKANCEKLNTEIEKLIPDTASVQVVQEMQRFYEMDCTEHAVPEKAPENEEISVPTKSDEEIAAEFDANLAAGLCGDGTKPNRFGCCTGEIFRDMGNAVFACCPTTGGDCFPPIK